jgi:superfamily I DNA/RNA helicase
MAKKSFFIKESELDEVQYQIIQKRSDKSFIVKGCAGSGKSILALWKVKQIQEENMGDFYFILFTKTLKQYMQDGIDTIGLNSQRVHYHWYWENILGAPSADYIIVDEAQDFSEKDIELFLSRAKKALILYGDSAQQIYNFKEPKPLSIEEITVKTRFPSEQLVYNHRLPKKIARLAQKISDVDDILELRCKVEGIELPKILEYNNLKEQLDEIIKIIKNREFSEVGIFFRTNNEVAEAKDYFINNGLEVEAKFNQSIDLDFNNDLPKITTYHSCKGLQFEAVFIPECNVYQEGDISTLYVAITRAYQSLFIMYSGNMSPFLEDIPTELYETSLIKEGSDRL